MTLLATYRWRNHRSRSRVRLTSRSTWWSLFGVLEKTWGETFFHAQIRNLDWVNLQATFAYTLSACRSAPCCNHTQNSKPNILATANQITVFFGALSILANQIAAVNLETPCSVVLISPLSWPLVVLGGIDRHIARAACFKDNNEMQYLSQTLL